MTILYHRDKTNVVLDALSRLCMGSVAHVKDEKEKLVQDVHRFARLGVQIVDFLEGSFTVHSGFESSFVVDVKSKQGLDPILIELKELVLKKFVDVTLQNSIT